MTPDEEQHLHRLGQELVALQALAADLDAHATMEQAERLYELDPPNALIGLAGITSARYDRIVALTMPPDGEVAFPREAFTGPIKPGHEALFETCLDFVTSIWVERRDDAALDVLLASDPSVVVSMLLGMTLDMANAVVQFDPDVASIKDLVAEEGVTSEQAWLADGGSSDTQG